MIASAHVAVGAAIGNIGYLSEKHRIRSITGIFLAGIISHGIMDRIPHEDYMFFYNFFDGAFTSVPLMVIVALELVCNGCVLSWIAIKNQSSFCSLIYTFAGIAGAAIPDVRFVVPSALYSHNPLIKAFDIFHDYFHGPHLPNIFGLLPELIFIAAAYWLIWKLQGQNSA